MTFDGETARRFQPRDAGGDRWRGDERHRVMAEALNRYGLWDHLSAELRESAMTEVATGCYPLHFDLLFEQIEFFADGEELAEGGVEKFLRALAPALVRYGVVLEVETAPDVDDYTVSINGIDCMVLRPEDWEGGDPWALSTIRPLAVVNQLLAAAGRSALRAHTLYAGGNEGLIFLMDPRAAEAMRASGLFPEHEVPALADGG
ncbi:hypothetical protein LO771_10150 [Streptacidiphilus sp. ASG 303]|uniref:hypothetical protein n=1 Tax=Streptacidiphilus sp. ASG 303 TaxID=2896847 RepID=UPI001E4450B9|nr:hypothetical protein [Streptacidiphilus sp. ASG 303]MCD0482749.1 hypothetical protein [Streptacidiphilus sp. ASG 303]